jgi:hypothetical protein
MAGSAGLDGPDGLGGLDGWVGRVVGWSRDHESSASRRNLTEVVQGRPAS